VCNTVFAVVLLRRRRESRQLHSGENVAITDRDSRDYEEKIPWNPINCPLQTQQIRSQYPVKMYAGPAGLHREPAEMYVDPVRTHRKPAELP
jgi:hypothetical protein